MANGTVVRFDEHRGYGFIAPDTGGDDVFVHASELTDRGVTVACGTRVQFNALDGGRGLKAYDVRVLEPSPGVPPQTQNGKQPAERDNTVDDLYSVFTERSFAQQITELLLAAGPSLTAAQIVELRKHLLVFGRDHGWVE